MGTFQPALYAVANVRGGKPAGTPGVRSVAE